MPLRKIPAFFNPAWKKILELGCGTGELLNSLESSFGTGIGISSEMVKLASDKFSHLTFKRADAENSEIETGPFDYIVTSDMLGLLEDIQSTLEGLHHIAM